MIDTTNRSYRVAERVRPRTTARHRRRTLVTTAAVAAFSLAATVAAACNIPVFRYALERWQPDPCQIVIFYESSLTPQQQERVDQIISRTAEHGGNANADVVQYPTTSAAAADQNPELAAALKQLGEVDLPHVLVRTRVGGTRYVNHWHGPLSELRPERWFDSPVRAELRKRLMSGHSVVWLMVASSDKQRNAESRSAIEQDLKELGDTVALPEGIGLPGSELHSEVPLLVRFSLLEIDPSDSREQYLASLLTGFYPEAIADGEPLFVPVFGRGRALEVIPAGDLDSRLTRDLTLYLAGACSCQVKEQNPGFDLLIDADWDTQLFGEDGVRPPPAKTIGDRAVRPQRLAIPPGGGN